MLAPMTLGVFYGWLPYSHAPGVSGESIAIHSDLRRLVAIQPSLWSLQTQLTILSHCLIHHLFTLHLDFPRAFQLSLIPRKGVSLAQMIEW